MQLLCHFRKSVIVRRKDYDTKSQKNICKSDYSFDNNHKGEEIITIAFNIREIENMYLREEKNYMDKIRNTFNETWQGVSLGEKVISETIELCKDEKKQQMSKELFQAVHMQIR